MSGIGVTNDFDLSAADGVTTVFTYTFFAYDASQVKVYSVLNDVETPITSGITITPNSNFVGGTVTFTTAPLVAVGDILRRREVPYTQTTEFTDIIRYKETGIEKAFNTIVMQVQQLASKVSRSMRYSEAAGTTETAIEAPVDGKALIFDGTTGRLIAGPDAADIANAQGYATSALSSKNAAAVSETNANNWAIAAQNAATGINWTKARAASTANVNIASPGATLDGVTLAVNDRVLLKNQTTASQNGIYIWTGAAVAMARATDMDTWPEVVSKVVQIEEGTANADLPYMATVNTGGTIGSTSITFVLFQAPLQDGAVSTALKIVDGILTYAKFLASEFATVSDIAAGTANKIMNAANFLSFFAPLQYGTKAYTTTGQAIPSGGSLVVALENEYYDDNNWHDQATNNSRITVNFSGRAHINANVQMNHPTAQSGYMQAYIRKNGTTIIANETPYMPGTGYAPAVSLFAVDNCASGDYYELVIQNALAAAGSLALGSISPSLSVQRVK